MKVAFLANSFHLKKTKSADFFIEFLRAHFESVTVIPHKEAWVELPGHAWDLIVVWQHRYEPGELEAFGADRVVLVPMYDDTPLDEVFWRKYKDFKVFCFSSTLERLLVSYGINAWGARYYPDPEAFTPIRGNNGLRGFFWPRTAAIGWRTVSGLIGGTAFDSMHLHWTPDVSGDNLSFPFDEANERGVRLEVSSWFQGAEEYRAILSKSTVFFASRVAEGIGMSFLEAMAMGLCVVAPRAPTMSEYIEDGVNGLLYDLDRPEPLDFSNVANLGQAARLSCQTGRTHWINSAPQIASFLEEPAPGYTPKLHPIVMMKGRGTVVARKIYRFMKRVTRKAP